MIYHVIVTREGDAWLADVPELEGAHTWARNLPTLHNSIREAIILAADLDDDAQPAYEIEYHTGDAKLDAETAEIRALRQQADEISQLAAERTSKAAVWLVQHGWSVRDTAAVLRVSPQRVSQLTSARADGRAINAELRQPKSRRLQQPKSGRTPR